MKGAEVNGFGDNTAINNSSGGVMKPACTSLLHGQNCEARPKHVHVGPCLHGDSEGPQILVGKCTKCGTGFRHIDAESQICCMCKN